jgi:hypothetical protein
VVAWNRPRIDPGEAPASEAETGDPVGPQGGSP